jgi:transposase-like protein
MKRHGRAYLRHRKTTFLRSYDAAMKVIGNVNKHETGRWLNNRLENSHKPFQRRAPSLQPTKFQAEPRRRSYRVARSWRSLAN